MVSNNITNDGAYDGKTAAACQEYVSEVVKAYIKRLSQVGRVGQVGQVGLVGQVGRVGQAP